MPGFDLKRNGSFLDVHATIECLLTGNWSDAPPVCEPKDCGQVPDQPQNGNWTYPKSTVFEDKAILTCDKGYKTVDNPVYKCDESGQWSPVTLQWSPDFPSCRPISNLAFTSNTHKLCSLLI